VLALAAGRVALDLRHRRLAHVHVRLALPVLPFDRTHHRSSPTSLKTRAIATASNRKIRSCAAGENDSHLPPIRSRPSNGRGRRPGGDLNPPTEGHLPAVFVVLVGRGV